MESSKEAALACKAAAAAASAAAAKAGRLAGELELWFLRAGPGSPRMETEL